MLITVRTLRRSTMFVCVLRRRAGIVDNSALRGAALSIIFRGRNATAVRCVGAAVNCAAQGVADERSRVKFIFGGCGGRALREPPKITPLCGAGARVVRFCGPPFSLYYFHTLPFVRTKGNLKTAAVKRFRGRPYAFAESDAFGTFEAIKRFPILNAPSPRPPFFRNRFCRG